MCVLGDFLGNLGYWGIPQEIAGINTAWRLVHAYMTLRCLRPDQWSVHWDISSATPCRQAFTYNVLWFFLYKNANARTSHCMHCMHAYTYMYRTYRRVHTRFSSNMKESLHTYAGLAELIINQRFINSSSVKRAIDILIIIRMNELSR